MSQEVDQKINLLREAYSVYHRMGKEPDMMYALCIFNLACGYQEKHSYELALVYFRKAYDMYYHLHNRESIETARCLNQMGLCSGKLRDEYARWAHYQQAYLVYLSLPIEANNQHEYMYCMSNLANCFKDQKAYGDAVILFDKANQIMIRISNGDNTFSAIFLHEMGFCYKKLRKINEARQCFESACQIYERLNITESKYFASSMFLLGIIYRQLAQLDLALETLRKACKMFVHIAQGDNPYSDACLRIIADIINQKRRQNELTRALSSESKRVKQFL